MVQQQHCTTYIKLHDARALGAAAKRWCKEDKKFIFIDRPKIIEEYNKHMGGTDLCDKLFEVCRVRQHTVNYYMHIFFYYIGISITNSWLLY